MPKQTAPKISQAITYEEFPDILTAKHISGHLHLSKVRVYELFRLSVDAGGIKSFDIGRSKRVVKQDYLDWLDGQINAGQ